jgi:histidine triad (HIT) family protein
MMKDCVFCKIVNGDLPAYKLYEDEDFLAFLDIEQWVDGHTLVIPKEHHHWVWDVPNIGEYFKVVKKVANHFKENMDIDLVMSVIYGVDVPHAHVHLFPEKRGEVMFYPKNKEKLTKEKGDKLVDRLAIED